MKSVLAFKVISTWIFVYFQKGFTLKLWRNTQFTTTASGNVCACVKLAGTHLLTGNRNGRKPFWSTFKGDFFCIPNRQQTCLLDWILWLSYVEVLCMGEGPFSWLIFIHLAPLMKQIKRSRGRLLWFVDLLTFKRSRISGLSSTICRAA